MAGQSARLSVKEVSSVIKKLENNKQTNGNGAKSGAETNHQLGRKGAMQETC